MGCSRFHTLRDVLSLLWEQCTCLCVWKCHLCVCLCVCVYTHHDNQQNILEVVSKAQCVAAEQGKVSFQELQDEAQTLT